MALKYEDIVAEFKRRVDADATVKNCLKTIRTGHGTYKTANKLAVRVGEILGRTLKAYAPYENINEWDLIDLIPKSLGLDHRIVADACKGVQETMNAKAGLNIKFQEPKFDFDRVQGLITELETHPEFTDIEQSFYEQLVNFSESIVDDSIRENAGFMWKAGVNTMVIRQAEYKCCEWCSRIAGAYEYDEVKDKGNDVWRRHENCRCTIDYITEKDDGFYQERVNNQKK